ncbi:MAG TPA: cellulase [Verrucomicrobiae bacterium]
MKAIAIIAVLCGICIKSPGDSVPSAQYQWHNAVIGGGGFVTGLVAHPLAKNLIYARTDVGGAYRWDENSRHWIPITDSFAVDFTGIESLAVDPNDTNRVYLAAGIYESMRSAIFRSDDQGRTWERTDVPFKMGGNETGRFNGERLVVSPFDGNVLFFGSRRDGLWKSADRGVTWNHSQSFSRIGGGDEASNNRRSFWNSAVGIISVLFDDKTMYLAVSTKGTNFFYNPDDGNSWRPVPGQPVGLRPNHVVAGGNGVLYLSYGKEPGPNEMTDGALWKFDPRTSRWANITPLKSPDGGQAFGYGAVAVDPQEPETILASTFCRWNPHDEIFRSTNGGATWRPLFNDATWDFVSAPYAGTIKPHWIGGIAISPSDSNRAWFTTGYGVWNCANLTSADSGAPTRWQFADDGLEETVPLALASPPAGAHLLSGVGDIDGFLHDNLDLSPTRGSFAGPHFVNTQDIAFAADKPQIIVRTGTVRSEAGHVAISTDGGKNWRFPDSEPAPDRMGGMAAISADGGTIVLTKRDTEPEFTIDGGGTWNQCAGLPAGIRVVADEMNSSRFYAFDAVSRKMFASTNEAAGFAPTKFLFPALTPDYGYPPRAELTATMGREGDLWLAFGAKGLWHSTDGGDTFIKIENVGDAYAFGCGKSASPNGSPALYLFGKIESLSGIYRSDDEGRTWLRLNDAEHQFGWISKLTGDPRVFGRVYLATTGRGIIYGEPLF